MEQRNLQEQINQINSKLDLILEEIELQRRHRRELEDLKDDLMRVGKDFYDTAVEELDEIHEYVNTKDLLHFGKYMLRNINVISRVIQQLESTKDFLTDVAPLVREYIIDFMAKLDEYDHKGYFDFMKESGKIVDKVVTSFEKEDVKALGDNVVTILNTVKNLTQPDMLQAINNAVNIYKNLDFTASEDISYFKIIKDLNTPEVKRGILFMLQFLKNISEQKNNELTNKVTQIN